MSEKNKGEQLREELLMNPKNLTETMSEEELKAAYDFCEGYKTFLDAAKTEHEAVLAAIALLEKAGY
ncbi:MAG TPA: aminopeptidase, partial [Ruminococcaceae bacterium]|nr:aminopeptidase [Oscillospiraceae bacterium]